MENILAKVFVLPSPTLVTIYIIYKFCLSCIYPFNDQFPSHKEISQLIYRANQLAGFYMREALVVIGLIHGVH